MTLEGVTPIWFKLEVPSFPTDCPYMEVVGSLICMAKFPWAGHSTANFFIFWSSELPTVSIYGSSGQPNLHGKIPIGSPLCCPLSCPLFSYLGVVGCLLSCPLFPYMEEVGSLICMAKFPWAAHSVAHVQPMGSEVGSSPVLPYGWTLQKLKRD